MQQLTDEGRRIVDDVARRHGFSSDAVMTMLFAVSAGYGNQAQFNHYEFGGMGQWSSGGMTMIGDMFNNYLKGRVDSLCQELSGLIQRQPMFSQPAQAQSQSQGCGWQGQSGNQQQGGGYQQQSSGGMSGSSLFVPGSGNSNWWPSDLGMAGSTGAQNNLRYAYFPGSRRLAIDVNGQVSVFDTGDHQIGGFSQQQSGDQSITFTSQFGLVRVNDLPQISPVTAPNASSAPPAVDNTVVNPPQPSSSLQQPAPFVPQPVQNTAMPNPSAAAMTSPMTSPSAMSTGGSAVVSKTAADDIFALIEKLSDLHKKGILTDSEYEAKKSDLLSRL